MLTFNFWNNDAATIKLRHDPKVTPWTLGWGPAQIRHARRPNWRVEASPPCLRTAATPSSPIWPGTNSRFAEAVADGRRQMPLERRPVAEFFGTAHSSDSVCWIVAGRLPRGCGE